MTNKEAHRLIRAVEKDYKGINATRWYSTVHPRRNGEAQIRTWAVKTWKGKPLIMLAAEYNTDGSQNHVSGRCIINNYTNQRCFNWLDYGGRTHLAVWSDIDAMRNEWLEAYDHKFNGGHEFFGRFLNGLENTKYRYCGWDHTGMRITDFIDCYKVSPLTELIAKSGLYRWLTPNHITRLVNNKPLARFLATHHADLRNVLPSIIQRQFAKHGEKTDVETLCALAELSPYGLAKLPIAPQRILRWMRRNGVSVQQLRHHVDNLNELKKSTAYEPHVLPHDWETYSLSIEEQVMEERELVAEREREIVRQARQYARKTIDRWMREGKIRKAYKIVIPASETELVTEGEAMHNCVGGYWNRIKSGGCSLAFIRKNGKPYIDLEIKDNGEIVQMRYDHNITVKPTTVDGRLCKLVAKAFTRKAA